jgi:hypothetical protein
MDFSNINGDSSEAEQAELIVRPGRVLNRICA